MICLDPAYSNPGSPISRGGARGFTLIELLTVLAIIGVLATLILAGLSSAKKKSRQAHCISNLRQISLALEMYLDDFQQRPVGFEPMLQEKYLANPGVLICREDKTGNWGGLVNGGGAPVRTIIAISLTEPSLPSIKHSYLHPWWWEDEAWKQLTELGAAAGVAACQLHGLGRPDPVSPSLRDYEGLVFRARRDGAVIRRQVFWDMAVARVASGDASFSMSVQPMEGSPAPVVPDYSWPLYADERP
jgi:prepilin-type N-terminal cleavage/methylation domain-containing protein